MSSNVDLKEKRDEIERKFMELGHDPENKKL